MVREVIAADERNHPFSDWQASWELESRGRWTASFDLVLRGSTGRGILHDSIFVGSWVFPKLPPQDTKTESPDGTPRSISFLHASSVTQSGEI